MNLKNSINTGTIINQLKNKEIGIRFGNLDREW